MQLEFWTLLNWASQGQLLGSRTAFSRTFVEPIVKGQDPEASEWVRKEAALQAAKLTALVAPIILQRKKEVVMQEQQQATEDAQHGNASADAGASADATVDAAVESTTPVKSQVTLALPSKMEHTVWVPMASLQRETYSQYLQTRAVSNALDGSRTHYPVEQINHLKVRECVYMCLSVPFLLIFRLTHSPTHSLTPSLFLPLPLPFSPYRRCAGTRS